MRLRGAALCVVAVALVLTSAVPSAFAASTSANTAKQTQLKSKIATLKDQVDEASAEEADLLGRLDKANAQKATLNGELDRVNSQIDTVQVGLDDAETQLENVSAQLVAAELKLSAIKVEVTKAREELRIRAVRAYVHQPTAVLADVSLELRSQRDLAAQKGYTNAIVQAQKDAVDHLRFLSLQALELQESVASKRDDARISRDKIAGQKATLQRSKDAQLAVVRQVQSQADEQQRLLDEVHSRKVEFETQIAALQHQSDSIAALLRGLQSGQGSTVSGHGVLSAPVPGAPITSLFGWRVHPIFGDLRLHTGIDFGVGYGTPIHAAADGVVVSAGPLGGYGNATIIDHGGSLATLYAHQSQLRVAPGQHVSRGQVIGLSGCSGYCTGPHLHFEVRVNGTPVDPLPYL
jgi:murein DD-endopeptidase MepM/ murein hydrolase activator NlpD